MNSQCTPMIHQDDQQKKFHSYQLSQSTIDQNIAYRTIVSYTQPEQNNINKQPQKLFSFSNKSLIDEINCMNFFFLMVLIVMSGFLIYTYLQYVENKPEISNQIIKLNEIEKLKLQEIKVNETNKNLKIDTNNPNSLVESASSTKQIKNRPKKIYSKSGTKITSQQYFDALDKFNMYKYINPKTKKVEFLDQEYNKAVINNTNIQTELQKIEKIMLNQQQYYEKKYNISQYWEIPFCIIIPSYKNVHRFFRNINSIMMQDYDAFHVILIDDASKDGTDKKVEQYIKKYQIPETKLKFIENEVNKRALPNIDYAARNLCNSGQIMAIIDGDDYLLGRQVFKVINAQYQRQNLLALYTNYIKYFGHQKFRVGNSKNYPHEVKRNRDYRIYRKPNKFPVSHLRTYFVDLYWLINEKDLKDDKGKFLTASNDFAIMMPILQMSGQRFEYLPQITYYYDAATQYNNFRTKTVVQRKNYKLTQSRMKYPILNETLQFEKKLKQKIRQYQQSKHLLLDTKTIIKSEQKKTKQRKQTKIK